MVVQRGLGGLMGTVETYDSHGLLGLLRALWTTSELLSSHAPTSYGGDLRAIKRAGRWHPSKSFVSFSAGYIGAHHRGWT